MMPTRDCSCLVEVRGGRGEKTMMIFMYKKEAIAMVD